MAQPSDKSGARFDYVAYLNTFVPIAGITLFGNGAAIVKRARSKAKKPTTGTKQKGQKIVKLTKAARKRCAFTALATGAEFESMITLTYGSHFPKDGQAVKSHLRRMLKKMVRYGIQDYFWWLEFQFRGAPHLHVLVDIPHPDTIDRTWLASAWMASQGIKLDDAAIALDEKKMGYHLPRFDKRDQINKMLRVHQHADTWQAIREPNGARRYVVKYMTKTYQTDVPGDYQNVGRFWGTSKSVIDQIRPIAQWELNEETLRQILTDLECWHADKPLIPKYLTDLYPQLDGC